MPDYMNARKSTEPNLSTGSPSCTGSGKRWKSQNKDGAQVPNDAAVHSTVGIGPRSEGGFGLDIELKVTLPGVPHDQAEALVTAICFLVGEVTAVFPEAQAR